MPCGACEGLTLLKGIDGIGITSITDNNDGTLTILYSNGNIFITPDFRGDDAVPLNWQTLPLINGWVSSANDAEYAISASGSLLYLRGTVSQSTGGGDTFNSSLNFGRTFISMVYRTDGTVIPVLCNNGVGFTGIQANGTPPYALRLDSIPVIRLEV